MKVSRGKIFYDKYGIYVILVALIIFFTIAGTDSGGVANPFSMVAKAFTSGKGFFSVGNLTNVLRTAAVYAVFGCGMTFVMVSGKIDLSVGAVAALVGCVASLCIRSGMTPIPASLVGIAVGLICGFVNGFCIAKLRVPFFIMTAGMMYAAAGLALVITKETSISIKDTDSPVKFTFWGAKTIGIIPSQFIIAIIFFIICFYVMKNTKMGRYTYAIGSNEKTARLSGVNVDAYNILIFTLNGLAAGIAGLILASRLHTGSPNVADGGYNILAIAAAAIGGTSLSGGEGNIAKTIVGAFVICVISTGLNIMSVTSSVQNIVIGAVLIIVVAVDMFGRRNKE